MELELTEVDLRPGASELAPTLGDFIGQHQVVQLASRVTYKHSKTGLVVVLKDRTGNIGPRDHKAPDFFFVRGGRNG